MLVACEKKERLLSRLEEQLESHALRPAVKGESRAITYAELESLSARCANALQEKSGQRFAPIALLMSHDVPLIAAIVGVLRSGGFYLALNANHPAFHLRRIFKEVRPQAIIADSEHLQAARDLAGSNANVLLFDELLTAGQTFTERSVRPDSPCALFYTSGSSQKPRPLVYTYGGTLQNVINHSRSLGISPEDRISLVTPCSAAASVSSIFGALLNGACLFPFNPVREGLHQMRNWIRNERITILHAVPSLFRRFLQSLEGGETLSGIRTVKLGGEPVFASDVELFRAHCADHAVLINGLGLTEANGNVCHFHVTPGTRITTTMVPVGNPLDGIEMTMFNDAGQVIGPGQTGEIAIRGEYVAPGFWTDGDIQKRGLHAEGWFLTGDLGRRTRQGVFEHLGRKDDQLKLHGHWLSIAEIEAKLMQIPGVKEAAVVTIEHPELEKVIAAFVSPNDRVLLEPELRSALRQTLPPYSIPQHFFVLAELPLLPNGKIDRIDLSQRAATKLSHRTTVYPDPADPLTLQLVRIWQKVLGNDAVGTTDDFFALGGDSLAAATMLAGVERFFGADLPVSTLIEAPTIEKLGALIKKGGWSEAELCLVGLQLRGNKPTLYCVPGAGSEALVFRELAVELGDDRPFFAFQPQGLDGCTAYLRSVEEMAAHYLTLLRRQQPRGPYHLCGTSFGGVVAFEMARRLVEEGEEVSFLALLDSYGGGYPRQKKNLSIVKRLRLAIRGLLPFAEKAPTLRSLRNGLKDWFQRRLVNLDLRLHLRRLPRPYRLRLIYLQEVCFAARRRYQAKQFPGRIHLFRIEHQPSVEFFEHDPLLGWSGMAADGIEVHDLPGFHGRHLRKPNVVVLAAKLRACLTRA